MLFSIIMVITKEELIGYIERLLSTNKDLAIDKTSEKDKEMITRAPFLKVHKFVRDFLDGDKQQRIVLLPGLRGVGKTTILFQIFLWLLNTKKIDEKRLFYVSLDYLVENIGSDIDEIFGIYEKYFLGEEIEKNKEPLFIFIDEAHYSKKWEVFAKNLYDRNSNVFILVSGSSAIALNTSSDSTRRTLIEEITPLSFQEYLKFKKRFFPPAGTAQKIRIALGSPMDEMQHILNETYIKLKDNLVKSEIDIEKELEEFVVCGGFPGTINQKESESTFKWIDSVLIKIVSKDIPKYSSIGSQKSSYIMSILRFFAESVPPSPQSASHIASLFSEKELSEPTARNILKALTDSCILSKLESNGSNSIKVNKKPPIYYFCTSTLRSALLWSIGKLKKSDSNHLGVALEETIFNHLNKIKIKNNTINDIRYDYKKGACDFIIKAFDGNLAVEVGWGAKKEKQIRTTMSRVKCKGGLKIDKCDYVLLNKDILNIPRELLLFA